MSVTKSQHYIPRFLLKQFCFDAERINVMDIKIKKHYTSKIDNVAQENHFYDLNTMNGSVSLEEQFCNIEDKTAPIINKIINTQSISWFSDEDFAYLEDFILCQIYRTRKYVNRVKSVLQANNFPLFDHFRANGDLVNTVYTKDIPIDDNVAKTISYNILYHIEHDTVVRDAMASMDWLLIKAEEGTHFIISDDPIVLNNRYANEEFTNTSHGFDLPHTQLFFPISPKLLLNLSAHQLVEESKDRLLKNLIKGQITYISDAYKCSITGEACNCPHQLVSLFNTLQRNNAERFIFGQ